MLMENNGCLTRKKVSMSVTRGSTGLAISAES